MSLFSAVLRVFFNSGNQAATKNEEQPMSLLSGLKKAMPTVVRPSQQQVSAKLPASPPRPTVNRDSFEQALPRPKVELGMGGISVSDGRFTAENTVKDGMGVSTNVLGDTLAIHFKALDGPATLGSVGVKAGGQEFVMGLVPAAPSPLPMAIYVGPERK